jgi:hypothetical protein
MKRLMVLTAVSISRGTTTATPSFARVPRPASRQNPSDPHRSDTPAIKSCMLAHGFKWDGHRIRHDQKSRPDCFDLIFDWWM